MSGLISAYKTSALETIKESIVIEKTVNDFFEIRFEYIAINDVMRILKKHKIEPLEQVFENNCYIKFEIRSNESENIQNQFSKIESLSLASLGSF